MNIRIAISTVADGNMLIHEDKANKQVVINRTKFLEKNGITIDQTSRVDVTYDTAKFRRYKEAKESYKGEGMMADDAIATDALITQEPGHALFLALADCVGTVIFDPNKHVLMLSHIGRHSLEQNGAYESIMFLANTYKCHPGDLLVWLTPAPGIATYPLFAFDNRAFKDVVFGQLEKAGITKQHITDDPSDTATDKHYFSHSEFLKGNRSTDGRYAIVAMMQD